MSVYDICHVIDLSISNELPLSWLQANITPIFKKGDRTLPSNIRPISLTSICCKLLEHIIYDYSNIIDHLDQHSVLSDKQHGFRGKHSTETQLILTTHDLSKSLNNKSQVDMIIMDFSKSFDTVPHNWLLNKLKRYGINNKTHAWITKFLTCRDQRVVVSGEHSPGPILNLVYHKARS